MSHLERPRPLSIGIERPPANRNQPRGKASNIYHFQRYYPARLAYNAACSALAGS